LLTVACAIPQPTPEDLGQRAVSPDVLLPSVDACFAREVARLPAPPSNVLRSQVADEAAGSMIGTCKEAQQWVFVCMVGGTPQRNCMDTIKQRARAAYENPS